MKFVSKSTTYLWMGLCSSVFSVATSSVLAQAPANDDFANATVLESTNSLTIQGTTYGATTEPGESGVSDTVWYSWTAPASGLVAVSGVAQANPLQATIVLGDDLLTAQGIASGIMTSEPVGFYAVRGITYKIQISDYVPGYVNYSGFDFTLGLAIVGNIPANTKYVQPDVNDDFDNPFVIKKNKINFVQYMANTSFEPFESALLQNAGLYLGDGYGSTWILWTPTTSGTAEFSAKTASGDDVYLFEGKGGTLANFKLKHGAKDAITFNCKAGKTYRLYIVASQDDQLVATLRVAQ